MLPGLMRTAATPASIAFSASDALKWMSAITGIGDRRTIFAQRGGVLVLRHRDADDLAAGRRERGDLRRRRLDVVRLRQRHRLDDDGRAAADRDAADADLPLARHRRSVYGRGDASTPTGSCRGRCRSSGRSRRAAARARSRPPRRARTPRGRTARPRMPSTIAKTMCPPSSGRSGRRFSSAIDREISASTERYDRGALLRRLGRPLDDPDGAGDLIPPMPCREPADRAARSHA